MASRFALIVWCLTGLAGVCGGETRALQAAEVALVPAPVSLQADPGRFAFTADTKVWAGGPAAAEARKLIDALTPGLCRELELTETGSAQSAGIALQLDDALHSELGSEGYQLEVSPQRIELRAAEPAGLFYAIQTLRQLLPPEFFAAAQPIQGEARCLPCLRITDRPRFAWRGLLIDPARHFLPKDDVLRFIDVMAQHKFNRLQMHLTDDQGWRIEIKKYPRLTEIGAWRDETLVGHYGDQPWQFDGRRHGGFYTQDDIRELVRYAAERYVTIVPEIEMPGHARAAIASYPELGVFPDKQQEIRPWTRWGISEDIFAPRPRTIEFCKEVLSEVMALFPSRYIHIGGDEAVKTQWKASAEIQQLIRAQGLQNEAELQAWFTKQIDAFLTANGRRLVGWDEILEGGLPPGAVVMSWRGEKGGIAAAQSGHDVIMAPTSHTYFDYYQGPRESEPLAIGGFLPLERVYQYEPVPAALTADQSQHVLGAQAQLWSEYIADAGHLQYMAYPRACALAEVLWSPRGDRNFESFLLRLDSHLARLQAAEVNFGPLDRKPLRWPGKTDAAAPAAARGLVQRLLPRHADRFEFEVLSAEQGRDVFEIESRGGQVVIRGNTAGSMATGLNWYLNRFCHCHVSLHGRQLDLPDPLPMVSSKVRQVTWARYRYFLNYCCFGYSLSWWDWDQWQELIDWMALHGVNMPLSVTGQEAVWQAVCRRLGMNEAEITEFLAGPPFLPFQWMGCLDGWGGPLPQDWIERHEQLQSKILARQRELGMTPVLQGFTGHVPAAVADKFPDAKLHRIQWIEWQTHLLDPLDPLFAKVARLFLEEQTKRFGTDHLYAADTFIEMTPPSGELEYLDRLSRAIYQGMIDSDPQAVWVLQGWAFMYQRKFWTQERIRAFLDAVPDERMAVLDLFCESRPMWNETEAFCGKPWLWCNIQNFGNTVFLGGPLNKIAVDLPAARRHPDSGQLIGLGFVNEGLGYNPVVHDLMFEMAWHDRPPDLETWIEQYARHRYGRANASAARAWQRLLPTVYSGPMRANSVVNRKPTLGGGAAGPGNLAVAEAWRGLLEAADELGAADTYRFDLVNVARQVLSGQAAVLHRRAVKAWQAKEAPAFDQAAQRFLDLLLDLDELLATRPEFLLGTWLEDAKRWGTDDAERTTFEWNARRVLTLWGEGPAIDDYASKEWSGLIAGYYRPRWQRFFDELAACLREDKPFDEKAFQAALRPWMAQWSDGRETYASQPRGDSVAVARRLWEKYADEFQPDALSLTTGKPVSCSHALPPYPAHLANDGWTSSTDAYWATDVTKDPAAWWQVDLQTPTTVGRVVVVCYYGDERHYGFTVETSLDGETWDLAADRRDNREPSTADGYTCRIPPRPVRYLRITQPHNSANTGRHLVEVMAFPQ
jgi:alpha-N-acetylglucosaminidase